MARPCIPVACGEVFGRLTVLECIVGGPNTTAKVRCECGDELVVHAANLRKGNTRSCGCSRLTGRIAKTNPSYTVWASAKARCLNKRSESFPNYGGRGITMCQAWVDSFDAFDADMGPRPSPSHQLDRIDNEGPYSPVNCRWATRKQQANNKRNNILLTVGGETRTLSEWAHVVGVPPARLQQRVRRLGWTAKDALSLGRHDSIRKLSVEQKADAKARCLSGESQTAVAKSLGIDQSVISRLVSGRPRKRVAVRLSGS